MTTLQCRYGDFFVPEREDLIINALREYGEWAQEELDLLSNFVRPGDTVLDIGTFIGTHARAFSQMVGAQGVVHAFEPNDWIYGALIQNSHLAFYQNIKTYQIALGASKHRSFIIRNNITSNLGATRLTDFYGEADNSAVEVHPLDEFIFSRVDFIKADVEGMEFDVLTGGEKTILQHRPIIFLEANSLQSTEQVIEWGRKRDYVVFGVISNAFNQGNYKKSLSNMFGNAKECGLLLIHGVRLIEVQNFIRFINLPVIETLDDLARLLVRKPQYISDVLRLSAEELVHSHVSKLQAVQSQLAATEAAKANAEDLAHGHLAKLQAVQSQLAATEAAKANAEDLAHGHLAKLEALQAQLAATEAAKANAEVLAHDHLAKLEALQAQLAATEAAKANAEVLAHDHLAKLEALQAQLAATEAAKANAEVLAHDHLAKLEALQAQLAATEAAKANAEVLAHDHLAKLEALQAQLAATEAAKANAEVLAHDHLAKLEALQAQLAATEAAKANAEVLAHDHLAKLEALQAQLAATEAAKANAEVLAHDHLAKLEALQAQLAATEAAKANAEVLAFDRLGELNMLRGELESITQVLLTTKDALNISNKRIAKILDSKGYKLLATLRLAPTKDIADV